MASNDRLYECVVLGATGYTGKYTAEHITTHLPTDFRWAIAGRSEAKLNAVANELKQLNPNRTQPDVVVAQLEKDNLIRLAKSTKVLITAVGPYVKYGTPVVEACVETGTHYLDVTGEIPWTYDMVQKHHDTAKKNGAIMIMQDGFESVPTDLLSWALVTHVRETIGVGTEEVIVTLWDIVGTFSGGSLATVMNMFESFTSSQMIKARNPWCLCPVSPPQQVPSRPLLERLTGTRSDRDMGTLTDGIQAFSDLPIVHRSWGLCDEGKLYGPKFRATAYMKSRNMITAIGFHLALVIAFSALALPPLRWLAKKFIYEPGQGPTKEQVKKDYCEWRAVANADVTDPNDPKRAQAQMKWSGSLYHFTGVCLAESAYIIAREKTLAHSIGGGMMTPATLGAAYLDRLQKAGLELDIKSLP
ncbi:uncharacterized protein LTR77_001600 [Saxophila tyrrhenica]|uniref:Saccharopine dehydrogenase NADP binding domain-containing protein n=1 Tax=Saxophila tyrrhenica TaxID=1690608 RepID=A0AAV9PKR3_9PEZI|nr:hypothetical protein LTR77_001600 [Saxophila tyrrhenica]